MTESKRSASARIRAALIERWPALFNTSAPVPLSIGIHESLLQEMPGVMEPTLRNTLCQWCSRPAYLLNLQLGASRYDLSGAIAGGVSEEAATVASERLAALKAQAKAREEAKRHAVQEEKARADAKAAAQPKPIKPPKPVKAETPQPKPAAKPSTPIVIMKKRRSQ
ncbi:ProQ/FINO family protein [Candidatus Methylospira mobilis]|uniref:ProQ/FINO family protein n=1 Tax=Candidatus Methylospira mobilis TaxID=1808979 RepID=UPI0028EC30FC|nr:ProQ/FINO family protein [Candidatus Methylospira mobilis]WNV05915.1 ProQ/FINO family protein [Candidatus Methylospira mobilis]